MKVCTKPLSPSESIRADWVPQPLGLNVRVSAALYAALKTQAHKEHETKATVIRRWLRNGALVEGFDIELW